MVKPSALFCKRSKSTTVPLKANVNKEVTHERGLCGDGIVLYFGCGHVWQNGIGLYAHIVPMSVSWFWYCIIVG